MSIDQKVFAALNGLAAGRAHRNVNREEPPTYPYIAFQFVTNPPADTFSHLAHLTNFHLQVTIYALDSAGLLTLRAAVLVALEAMPEHIVRDTDIEMPFEFETKSYPWILGFHLRDADP